MSSTAYGLLGIAAIDPAALKNIVFSIVSAGYAFETYVSWRQHRQLSIKECPKELKGLCTPEDFERSRIYALDRSRFSLVEGAFSQIIMWGETFTAFLPWLWFISAGLVQSIPYLSQLPSDGMGQEIATSLVFLGLSSLFSQVLTLPFSIYSTFVLEAKHGFNQTTVRTFVMDIFKSNLLRVALGGPIAAAFLWLLRWGGQSMVLYVGIFMIVLSLLMQVLLPTVIMPLFNKFTPLPEGSLRTSIEALASKLKFPLTKLFVVDGSTRSSHSNAYFFGLFSNKRIVLFDTLIEQCSESEILAILCHELGHWYHMHTLQSVIFSQIHTMAIFYLFSSLYDWSPLYMAFGFAEVKPMLIGLMLFNLLLTPLNYPMVMFFNGLTRRNEFQADRFALEQGYVKELEAGLIKIYQKNKGLTHPDWLYSLLTHTHPPPSQRIAAIHAFTAKKD